MDGAAQILSILREQFAPDAIDIIFQDMVKFMYSKRTDRYMDTYLTKFDMLRQKAEARMLIESGLPDEFVSVLCMQNAALSKNAKTLVSPWTSRTWTSRSRQSSHNIGLPGRVSTDAPIVWAAWLHVQTGCPRGHGVGRGGF